MAVAGGRLLAGCMSGTSADGIDTALLRLDGKPLTPRFTLLARRTDPFPSEVREQILACAEAGRASTSDLAVLHVRLGELYAAALVHLLDQAGVAPDRLDAVGLHGQTVYHAPERGVSLQIGSAAVVAERLGCDVVYDFRSRDLAAGGQGAPLVPYADAVLFRSPEADRITLNLGGIANLTWLPAGQGLAGVSGFDTGPGNMIMDALVGLGTRGEQSFDRGGAIARAGTVVPELLEAWLDHPFFGIAPPRSTGRETFGTVFVGPFWERESARHSLADLVRTALELTVETVGRAHERWLPALESGHRREMIVSGGGARNPVLMQRLAERLAPVTVMTSEAYDLPVEAREAVAFALLADACRHGVPAGLPAVTGARRACVLGALVAGSQQSATEGQP